MPADYQSIFNTAIALLGLVSSIIISVVALWFFISYGVKTIETEHNFVSSSEDFNSKTSQNKDKKRKE